MWDGGRSPIPDAMVPRSLTLLPPQVGGPEWQNAAMESAPARAMARVVDAMAPSLNAAGFGKRRHLFNRSLDRGMTQVVHFQMGASQPPGAQSLPLRPNLYGQFTVNLGVFVPEMVIEPALTPGRWVNGFDCQLRQRLGNLMPAGRDLWWSLGDPDEAVLAVRAALASNGLPWLDRIKTREALLVAYRLDGPSALGMASNAPLLIAWLLAATDRSAAEAMLEGYLAQDLRPEHRAWVEQHLIDAGFGRLIRRD